MLAVTAIRLVSIYKPTISYDSMLRCFYYVLLYLDVCDVCPEIFLNMGNVCSVGSSRQGASRVVQELGNLLEAMTKANDGKPPMGAAWDGGGGNSIINAAFLGMVSIQKLPPDQVFICFQSVEVVSHIFFCQIPFCP